MRCEDFPVMPLLKEAGMPMRKGMTANEQQTDGMRFSAHTVRFAERLDLSSNRS